MEDILALHEEIRRLNGLLTAAYSLTELQVKKIKRLEETIHELRHMPQESNTPAV